MVVKGLIGSLKTLSATASFVLTLKNPCIDSKFVSITPVPLFFGPHSYTLFSGSMASPIEVVSHSSYAVTTTPLVGHTLCGPITYTA